MPSSSPEPADSPRRVLDRFYGAERAYMQAGGAGRGASFDAMAATLDPDVVLHQSPDLPFGGDYHGHDGYRDWAAAMSDCFDRLEVLEPAFFENDGRVVVVCRLLTRGRQTGVTLELPMAQVVTARQGRITEFRPFYWNVPAYVAAVPARRDRPWAR